MQNKEKDLLKMHVKVLFYGTEQEYDKFKQQAKQDGYYFRRTIPVEFIMYKEKLGEFIEWLRANYPRHWGLKKAGENMDISGFERFKDPRFVLVKTSKCEDKRREERLNHPFWSPNTEIIGIRKDQIKADGREAVG